LSRIPELLSGSRILDVGCGPGRQTRVLARRFPGSCILAIDTHEPYLECLRTAASAEGLGSRITALPMSMQELSFADSSFDVIWSEGAAYILGFDQALRSWRRLLKPGGFLGLSELSWIRPDAPARVKAYWVENYPSMRFFDENARAFEEAGYTLLDRFVLPDSDWWDGYYSPQEERIEELRRQYAGDPESLRELQSFSEEIELFREFSEYYGYGFFIGRKDG
jgi:SAM-dependent methyltransferase